MKSFTLLMALTVSIGAYAEINDSNEFLKAASGSGWGVPVKTIKEKKEPVKVKTSTQADIACTKDDQTSMPYAFFSEIVLGGNPIDSSFHDSKTGLVKLRAPAMMTNCSDMIEFDLNQDEDNATYAFEVKFTQPDDRCKDVEGDKLPTCTYDVVLADKGIATGKKIKKSYKPNLDGFMQCLKDAEVFKDGKINPNKIARANDGFYFERGGFHQTGELLFLSHGPEAAKQGAMYSKQNERPKNGCLFYEKISDEGRTLYSAYDERKGNMQNVFNSICSSGNYKEITEKLPDFAEFKSMQSVLRQIRNQLIEDENKSLHDELKAKSFAHLDPDKFQKVTKDFYENIVEPVKENIATLINELDSSKNSAQRKQIQEEIDYNVKKLTNYARPPYISNADRKSMRSFSKRSPLDSEEWRNAIINNYAVSNSAFHYSKLSSKEGAQNLSIADIRGDIDLDLDDQVYEMNQIGTLAENKDVSFVGEANRRISRHQGQAEQNSKDVQREINISLQKMQQCSQTNYTQMNVKACQEDELFRIQDLQASLSRSHRLLREDILAEYDYMRVWESIENERNKAYGIKPFSKKTQQPRVQPQGNEHRIDPRAISSNWNKQRQNQIQAQNSRSNNNYYQQNLRNLQTQRNSSQYQLQTNSRAPANQWSQRGNLPQAMQYPVQARPGGSLYFN